MTYLESFILGLVQGLGEFLPISSSAHLVIAPWFFQFEDPGLAFDVALHLGTLLAVLFYFWKDWWTIFTGSTSYLVKKDESQKQNWTLLIYLVLATVPGALAGLLLNDYAEHELRHPLLVAFNMILLGAILFWTDNKANQAQKKIADLTLITALIIGCSQALALFPGVSRSGITITAALFLGFTRTESARFSFLLSTPIILGACVLKYEYFLTAFNDPKAILGIATAAVFGFLSIKYLMKLVRNFSYRAFCYYRFVFGITVFVLYFMRNQS